MSLKEIFLLGDQKKMYNINSNPLIYTNPFYVNLSLIFLNKFNQCNLNDPFFFTLYKTPEVALLLIMSSCAQTQ